MSGTGRGTELRATVAFFVLAYALSWWPSLFEPHSILPLGPLAAALVVLALQGGRAGVTDLLRRVARFRVAPGWYGLVLLAPLAITAAAAWINRGLGAAPAGADRVPSLAEAPATFLITFGLIGLGEEPAWRGFALPRLSRLLPPLAGVVVLFLLHALWHLPLFGSEYDSTNGLPWAFGLLAYTVATAWLYTRTGGNLLLPALLHASVNTSARYFFAPLDRGPDLVRLWWLWAAAWWVAAILPLASLVRDSRRAAPGSSPSGTAG